MAWKGRKVRIDDRKIGFATRSRQRAVRRAHGPDATALGRVPAEAKHEALAAACVSVVEDPQPSRRRAFSRERRNRPVDIREQEVLGEVVQTGTAPEALHFPILVSKHGVQAVIHERAGGRRCRRAERHRPKFWRDRSARGPRRHLGDELPPATPLLTAIQGLYGGDRRLGMLMTV